MNLAKPIPLDQAAVILGITEDDASNPSRLVRDLIRRFEIPFVKHGRTVKLAPDQLRLLSEKMIR